MKELLQLFNEESVEALIVGAHAVGYYARPRNTGDLDLFIGTSIENVQRLRKALDRFGFTSGIISNEDLAGGAEVLQLGRAPGRVDLLTSISGVSFEDAWSDRVPAKLFGIDVNIISRPLLLKNKQATGRPQDLADILMLSV